MNYQDRYQRQSHAFPHERRAQTFIADLGGQHATLASALLKAGAAAAGVGRLASDFHGVGGEGRHWLLGTHDALVTTVNGEVAYDYLDPWLLRETLESMIAGYDNAWLVVHLNEPAAARAALEQLAGVQVRVLLVLCAPGGAWVERHAHAASALERLNGVCGGRHVPAGPPELAVAAAGAALNEIMLGNVPVAGDPLGPRSVLLYSLHRRRRIDTAGQTALEPLLEKLAAEPERATFTGRRIKQIGAGALGNWTSLGVALDGGVHMELIDGDPRIEPHNLNRQVLLVQGVGRPKAPVLVEELAAIDPRGTYTDVVRRVEQPLDLQPLAGVDAMIVAPDNNAARLLGTDVAWRQGVPCAAGGTSANGGQLVIQQPGRACFRCITGLGDYPPGQPAEAGASCVLVANESIVASNMVVAGLLVSELRQALAGRRSVNLRFFGDSLGDGNRLGRMPGDLECPHLAAAGSEATTCAVRT